MAHCLYESLRAVGLQHHYDRLSSVGVRSLAHLTVLTLDDFPLLGIQTMQDRTRLFHLIQMLKTVDAQTLHQAGAEGESGLGSADHSYNRRGNNLSSVCKQLSFSSENANSDSNNHKGETEQWKCSESEKSVGFPGKRRVKQQMGGDAEFTLSSTVSKQNSKTASPGKEAAKPQSYWTSGEEDKGCPQNTQGIPIYQSKTSEYNYGLPQRSAPATPSRRNKGEPRIWVCVRKRPLTSAEERRKKTDVVSTPDESCVIVHESKESVDLTHYVLQHRFFFDHVFGEDCSNEEVYLQTASPLVQHMLSGGSSTCFAYGQTGAGKTHTMLGSPQASGSGALGGAGLYALAVRDLFTHLSASPALAHFSVFVSFFEIYCGQLYDLLDHRKRLFAREDGQRTVHIAGLCHVRVDTIESLLEVIWRGTDERRQGSSGVNPLSSRSHAMLQIQLRDPQNNIYGRMWFVDLAGSERASDSRDPDRQSRIEGAEINQSLLALKECIRSLDQEQSHTPFRQSKLTQVLRDSFVGDSMTCMIANISPVHSATEHTLNTLRYADRVKELKGQGPQRRRSRTKNAPSPVKNLPQSLRQGHSRSSRDNKGGLRGTSPSKKPKTNSPVPAVLSPVRAHDHFAFLSSTPKSSASREDRTVRRLFQLISPVQTPPNQATKQKVQADEWAHWDGSDQDQERKKHLKLYHQQLQQYVPSASYQTSLKSSLANVASKTGLEDILGLYRAHVTQMQQSLPNCEANIKFQHRKSGMRELIEETNVLPGKNATKCDRKCLREIKMSQDGGARWAWSLEKEGDSVGNSVVNPRRRLSMESCDTRAPAERPLSPVTDHTNSLLTLSALNHSELNISSNRPENLSTTSLNIDLSAPREESAVMEPMSFSMLAAGQQPVTHSFLQDAPEEEAAVIPVCMGWEPEENTEESYLEVPQAISVSMIPVAIRLHSQQKADPHPSIQTPLQNSCIFNNRITNCLLSQLNTAPHPGHSGNSSNSNKPPDNHTEAHLHIVQAHLETLKEMEVLSHKEGTLLIQQSDMAFVEYVQQLEDIMRTKAVCIRSMIAHLQPYLKSKHPSAHL